MLARMCPLCERLAGGELLAESELAAAFSDAFPVSPGHALVIPRRHEADFFALSPEEQAAMWALVVPVRRALAEAHAPAGFNLGMNVGAAAGQTVGHAHLHVIPRYAGDAEDPRGGVRWVLPARAAYWER
jgi:diadenosine tetraphosphate (Ap4A) HIT family hydrolase